MVSKLSADDFKVTASLKELSKVNSVPINVSVKQGSIARRVTIEKQSAQTLLVEIEEIRKETFDIEVEYTGNAASGFVPSNYTLSKNQVTITAPNSILKEINRVVAQCELEGNREDFTSKCQLTLYDSQGNVLKAKQIKMSSRQVDVTVELDQEKEIPVEIGNIGTPAEGYEVKRTVLSQDKVKLVGDSELLKEIEKISLADDIDISNAKKTYTKTIDLKQYIPEGVTIHGDSTIKIEIEISPLSTRTITIKAEDIKIRNQGDNEVKVSKNVKITLQGEADVLSQISAKDISASVNVDKLSKGKHNVPVELDIPENVMIVEDVNVQVTIK